MSEEDYFEDEVLFTAAKKNYESMFEEFYEERKKRNLFDANILDAQGNTPLHYSATFGHVEISNRLLDLGANPNIQNKAGETPLHKAVWYDRVPLFELLIERGANPTIANNQKQTVTHLAKSSAMKDLIKQATLAATINKEDFADDDDDDEDDAEANKPYKPSAHDHSDMVAADSDDE
ncbi:hypothetical protein DICPUDRAFT_91602 [Dictyostelium purpureum]|uniref:Uncharacterized protein n=1 Tax=Dictyostelium purpureum TaxID=5786 RepID=F0ZEQ9_DICPU|nr:uncharacterized protein DICPUDRAFT_91602 [Dictyostelium purpureum]EGC37581.1 hypothetical protein DICPUDRAFT_91602 [Dictyostelium purpureum]|eukprot:XP_003285907.1 hypothetical protein DICPUDRAFT_91602 [Dictyostelium purpureum]